MKKLTAGIFSVLIGLCSMPDADAAVASKQYVDAETVNVTYGDSTTYLKTTKGIQAADVALDAAISAEVAARQSAVSGVQTALDEYQESNDAAVSSLQTAVGDGNDAGLLFDVKNLKSDMETINAGGAVINDGTITKAKLTSELQAEINSFQDANEVAASIADAVNTATADMATNASVNTAIDGALANYTTEKLDKKQDKFTVTLPLKMDADVLSIIEKGITGALIQDETITGDKLVDKTITGDKLKDGAVDSDQLADAGITKVKLDDAVAALLDGSIQAPTPTDTDATDGAWVLTARFGEDNKLKYAWEDILRD